MPSALAETSAWGPVLDELEQQLDAANHAATSTDVAESAVPWQPPARIGPIPAHLQERARDLLLCQRKVMGELNEARRIAGQHLAALRMVPREPELSRSVYLDTSG